MGDVDSPTAERPGSSSSASANDPLGSAENLTLRHFVAQAERPDHLADVDLVAADPYLRGLLFTNGTVTRALEVQELSPVSVTVVGQQRSPANGEIAAYLNVPEGTDAIRRRVLIGPDSSPEPTIWAESHIVLSRLPDDYLRVLEGSPEGIGESLQQVKLEVWRELLWFGIDTSPAWSDLDEECAVLRRLYRMVTRGQPAILISESFAIEQRDGAYHLAG
jgi:chorismate-pyruvate lyase